MRRTEIVTASDFYSVAAAFTGAAFRGKQLIGFAYTAASDALTLNPESTIREAWVYFDNDPDPELLIPGRVIARTFNRASFAPVMPSSFLYGRMNVHFAPRADFCPQRLILDFWSGEIPTVAPTMRHSSISTVALVADDFTNETPFVFLRAPNVESIRFWVSNNNTENTGGDAEIKVYGMRPNVRDDQDPRSPGGTPDLAPALTAVDTLTLGGTADGDQPTFGTRIDHPAYSEYGVTLTPASTDPVNVIVGCEITWRD